jgi:hypothetical protein
MSKCPVALFPLLCLAKAAHYSNRLRPFNPGILSRKRLSHRKKHRQVGLNYHDQIQPGTMRTGFLSFTALTSMSEIFGEERGIQPADLAG